ncbi:MAG: hypothetical protein HKN92_09785 [Chitinophagales bacterium]|nr:hypothetical protein [Chitinophagales bacterium]
MNKLNPNWLTEGLLDLEYKKYVLLAYLKDIEHNFNENKLYPFLGDLIFHYNNLNTLKNKKEIAANSFPSKISKIDFENFKIEYEKLMDDSDSLEVIQDILEFAIPKVHNHLKEGKQIYEFVEEQMEIEPVGVVPLNNELGYLMLRSGNERQTNVFEYTITIFESAEEQFRGIKTTYIDTFEVNLSNTLENVKIHLIKKFRKFTNPATYIINSKTAFPFQETLMPVAKRSFVKYISTQ